MEGSLIRWSTESRSGVGLVASLSCKRDAGTKQIGGMLIHLRLSAREGEIQS